MMARSPEELRRDQEAILQAYRREQAPQPASEPAPSTGAAPGGHGFVYGQVVDIVYADPEFGPHLLAMRQAWHDSPRGFIDAGEAPIRCYPVPPRTLSVFDYGDFIRISIVDGAFIAELPA